MKQIEPHDHWKFDQREEERETAEHQAWLNECAKHCRCSRDICDSVLQGAPCEERIEAEEPDWDDNLP